MRVAVLGCGPAGLMAAHAAAQHGARDLRIYSKRRKSEMFGAQFLHAPIPGMTDTEPVQLSYEMVGTHEDYRRKVYGELQDVLDVLRQTTSTQEFVGMQQAWDIRRTYDRLWDEYGDRVQDTDITGEWARECLDSGHFDIVFSTIPLPRICLDATHSFIAQPVWAAGDAPERGVFSPIVGIRRNFVVCNGLDDTPWYRVANVFSRNTVEWPDGMQPVPGASLVQKPLTTDCTCHEGLVRLGRYGEWKKGVLTHHAYLGALAATS